MPDIVLRKITGLQGQIRLPPDKSISHRLALIASISRGKTIIRNFSLSQDCLRTLKVLKDLGVKARLRRAGEESNSEASLTIWGKGLYGLSPSSTSLYLGESGTTMRLLLGILAGQRFKCVLRAAPSLNRRPMKRVTAPLRLMGARIIARKVWIDKSRDEEYPPLVIEGGQLKSIGYKLPIASAQVKSAILMAGLYAKGWTSVEEPNPTRDHTERILKAFGARLEVKEKICKIKGRAELSSPGEIEVPGDFSSASFFIVAATIIPHSCVIVRLVGLNPRRSGLLDALRRMGAKIKILNLTKSNTNCGEPIADILVESSRLQAIEIKHKEIPRLIDELPILMVAASKAKGATRIRGASELRVKETDRINSMYTNLRKMKADICVRGSDIVIRGRRFLEGGEVSGFGDHRTAMSMIVAGLCARGKTKVTGIECIDKSFPGFLFTLKQILPKEEKGVLLIENHFQK
jgi:3-phosphoshikimate 1-carboxyvinyltransferase